MYRQIMGWIAVLVLATGTAHAATLEIPTPHTTLSGIGVISGWKCDAGELTVRFDGGDSIPLVYGSERKDVLDAGACDHSLFKVGFEEMSALKGIQPQHRSSFTLSSEGSYLHWPEGDVHIDLDAIRCLKDEGWRRKKERERLLYDLRFGEAVAALRKQRGIKQAEIQGLSEHQVRRIEKGERTKLATLAVVAGSHGLSLEEYPDEIAEMLS